MALVKQIVRGDLKTRAKHSEVECTYAIVTEDSGERILQLDTYGSNVRRIPGKKSQSLRFGKQGLERLKAIIAEHGL